MTIDFVKTLKTQRELHNIPRGIDRFHEYLRILTNNTPEIVLPLGDMNPMGKDHVPQKLDELMKIHAEEIAENACKEAALYFPHVSDNVKMTIVIVDDLMGGWTNRYYKEINQRFQNQALAKRGWAPVSLWVSEDWTKEKIHEEVLIEIYRWAYKKKFGYPKTLKQMMMQEGFAHMFAGRKISSDQIKPEEVVIIENNYDSDYLPTILTCLYGDEPAQSVGYKPKGLSTRVGYKLALLRAIESGRIPESIV